MSSFMFSMISMTASRRGSATGGDACMSPNGFVIEVDAACAPGGMSPGGFVIEVGVACARSGGGGGGAPAGGNDDVAIATSTCDVGACGQ